MSIAVELAPTGREGVGIKSPPAAPGPAGWSMAVLSSSALSETGTKAAVGRKT